MGTKRGAPRGGVTKESATIAERRRRALELKKAGATYEAIAQQLGYANRGNAYRDVQTALKGITREAAEDYIKLQMERYDTMLLGLWAKASKGDAHAIDRALQIMNQQNKIAGAYAPTRQTITVISEDVVDAEIRRLEEQLASRDTDQADAQT